MTCRDLVDLIDDALEGELLLTSRRAFERHLSGCGECRRYLRSYRTTVDLVRRAFDRDNASPPGPIPEDLIEKILLDTRPALRRRPSGGRPSRRPPGDPDS